MKAELSRVHAVSVVGLLLIASCFSWQLSARPTIPSVSSLPASAVLDQWATLFTSLGNTAGEHPFRTQVRITILQLAMFDAVNAACDGRYRPFAFKPPSEPDASAEAAAIGAAHFIALNEFQSQSATIESFYHASLAGVVAPSDEAIAHGIDVGETAAQKVLDARVTDHRNISESAGYTPGSGPGVWVPTPPTFSPNPQTPFLQFVTPFGYEEPSRFRPAAPPALDSKTYAADYNEVKEVGRLTNSSRTPEQSATAQFWSPSAVTLWNANVRSLAGSMDLLTAARFEAIGIAAITNALIACWDAKYTYMFWRPVTAIRNGGSDGNPETDPDPTWEPFIVTPFHPEYPSAHTMIGASALGFYTVWFGTDQFELKFKGLNGAVRTYSGVNQIHEEEGNARIWGGMHWRNSSEVGAAVGSKVGKYTATHLLKPLD